jgi:drug/metabolite transporter (DMT)-like permease
LAGLLKRFILQVPVGRKQGTMKRREAIALIEAVFAIVIWGISFVFMKIALREISAVTVIVLRYAVGTLMVGLFAWQRGDFARLATSDLPSLALVGVVGITLQQLLQVSGQVSADASVAAFLAATAPAFTVLLAAVWLRERLSSWQLIGVVLASLGGILVATGGELTALSGEEAWRTLPGNVLILLSAIVWAVFVILSKRLVLNRPAALVTTGMFFFGLLFTLPLFWIEKGWLQIPHLSNEGWGAMLYVAVLSTAVAYLLNSHALKTISVARVAAIHNLEPLVAVVGAALILNESLSMVMVLGGAAILAGVYLAERHVPEVVDIQLPP